MDDTDDSREPLSIHTYPWKSTDAQALLDELREVKSQRAMERKRAEEKEGRTAIEITRLHRVRDSLRAEANRFKGDHEDACKTIADMHAAAMGEVCGPNVGVVEDVAALRAKVEAFPKTLDEFLRTMGDKDDDWPLGKRYGEVCERARALGVELARLQGRSGKSPVMRAGEAVFGVLAWLTTRKEAVTIGSYHECGQIAELAKEYCDANDLGDGGPLEPATDFEPEPERCEHCDKVTNAAELKLGDGLCGICSMDDDLQRSMDADGWG